MLRTTLLPATSEVIELSTPMLRITESASILTFSLRHLVIKTIFSASPQLQLSQIPCIISTRDTQELKEKPLVISVFKILTIMF